MGIALIQQVTGSTATGTTIVVTIAAATPGNALICLSGGGGGNHVSGISGGGVTWVLARQTGTNSNVDIWYGLNSTGVGTSITVTYTATIANGVNVNIQEWDGIERNAALDKTNIASGSSTNPATGATAATARPVELVVAAGGLNPDSAVTAGPTNGFTALTSSANSGRGLICAYKIVSAVGTYATDWTVTTSAGWDANIATFIGIDVSGMLDDISASYPVGFVGGRSWPAVVSAQQIEESFNWTNRVLLPVSNLAPPYGVELDTQQAHDILGGRSWQALPPARQIEEMTAWTQRVILPPQNFDDDDLANRVPFNLAVWTQPEDESDFASDALFVIPPFDPTTVPLFEQLDIPSSQYVMEWEDDSPLNIFLPPPGWDDGFDFSFRPVVKLEEYREEGAVPIIPSAFDDDFLFSFQPQMKIDDERDYQMVIIIPGIVHDDDWTQNWQQSPMKIDDERDYQVRIFLPNQVLDDDWQRAVSPQMKLEEVDNGLLIILPPFDPTVVPQAEQMDSPDLRALLRDDWTDSPLQLFLPPFDPTQRPVIEDGDSVINAQARWVDMEDGRALEIFLPPSPWTEDADSLQKPQPPANLSVEPEGEWFNLIVVLPVPPDTGPIPGRSAFILVRGIHIKR